jgi:cbb3-type cytochrome oxidase subunit 3
VQFNFLRFYNNIFVVFMFIIFIATQHSTIEYVISSIVVAAAILFQNIYFRNDGKRKLDDEDALPMTLDDLDPSMNISYREKYNHFLDTSKSDKVDLDIKQ